MRSVLRVVLVLSFVSALAGCATKTAIPYDRSSSGKVQTIGILEPGLPSTPSVVLASTVGQSFGLLGVLVDAGLQSSRDSKMTSILNNNNFVANKVLVDKLTVALQAKGYEVKVIPAARPDKSEFVSRYPSASETKVDAYLDVVSPTYGYLAAGTGDSSPYRPRIAVNCKLIRASDAKLLMEDKVLYNPLGTVSKVVSLSPDPNYSFTDFDALTASPDKATEGLKVAFGQTADAIATLLQ